MQENESVIGSNTAPGQASAVAAWIGQVSSDGYVGEHARTRMISEHYDWIKRRCKQLISDDADALDAAQEVVIRVHRSVPNFEGRSSVHTWLNSIIYNECIDQYRRGKRHRLTPKIEMLLAIHQWVSLEEESADDETETAVHDALCVLPVHDREVLHLRFFSDLPIFEIASLLGLSLSATKMRLYRALATFKRIYLDQFEEPLTV